MTHDETTIRAAGAALAEAYVRLDQAEAALYAYYHTRLGQIRHGERSTRDEDESLPLRQALKAAHLAVLGLHSTLGEARTARGQADRSGGRAAGEGA